MSTEPLSGHRGLTVLRDEAGLVEVLRDVIVAEGPDALKFLQSQLSQDLTTLGEGTATWSFLLQPAGKLVGFVRVVRTGSESYRIDGDPGVGSGIEAALRRFLIRTKCTLALTENVPMVAVRGPGSLPLRASVGAVDDCFPSMTGFDVFADNVVERIRDLSVVAPECYEYLRIASGVPMWPYDLTESTIPNATGLISIAVSFTKGCYVGQELVERIDSRGAATPRSLRRIHFKSSEAVSPLDFAVGAEVFDTSGSKGSLTSVASIDNKAGVALAYLHRDVAIGAVVTLGSSTGVAGMVSALEIG